jgi:peptidoglycan/xylan/chitin deacetylase (PgdA/CDA1 family)
VSEAREFVGYGVDAPRIEWPGNARIAVSLVVNFEEGAEQTPLYGDAEVDRMRERFFVPPGHRDLRTESFFDLGGRVGFWRLLNVFDEFDVKATFFISGHAIERNPLAGTEITRRGHEPCGHGYRWAPLYTLDADEERRHIEMAVKAIEKATGQRPLGWNSRGQSLNTRRLLIEEGGFLYDSDSYAEDLPYFVAAGDRKWLTIPYSFETNDMKFFRSPGHGTPSDFLAQLIAAFDCLYAEGDSHPKMMSVGLHMRYSGAAAGISALRDFMDYARAQSGVWFARRIDIARWWLEHYDDGRVLRS